MLINVMLRKKACRLSWESSFRTLDARPTIMHREPSALGPVHDLIDSKQRRGAINQWVCYGGYRGFDITVFDI